MTPDEERCLEHFRQEAAKAFYKALRLTYRGQAVEVSFEPRHPIVLPILTGFSATKDVEPRTIDVRKLVADILPGLWGYFDAEIGPRQDEMCTRCGKVFDMNEKRETLDS